MRHQNRLTRLAIAGSALAMAMAIALPARAGHSSGGSHGSSGGHSSGGHSSGGHVSSGSGHHMGSGHYSSGRTTTTPSTSYGRPYGGDRGRASGGYYGHGGYHGSGGYYGHGGHGWYGGYHGWYDNWLWCYAPYWASWGWMWGSPWIWNSYGDDWRYSGVWGPGPHYADIYAWRPSHGAWANRFARVKAGVSPDETELWLDGAYIGTSDDFDGFPDYLYLEPGSYKVEFRLVGYQTWASDVTIRLGEVVKLEHEMAPEPGKGRLSSFLPESKGMPFGRYFGKDGRPVSPEARSRSDRRQAPKADEEIDSDDADARSGASGQMDGAASAQPVETPPVRDERIDRPAGTAPADETSSRARIRWEVTPGDAAIWIDDEYAGTGEELSTRPRGTVAAAGQHTVTVVRPGFKTRSVKVEAKAGEAIDVVVALEK